VLTGNIKGKYACYILSRFMCDHRRGVDCWIVLLTTYTHHSELQAVTVLELISTLYKSLHAKSCLACSVFNSRSLTKASNSGWFFSSTRSGSIFTVSRTELHWTDNSGARLPIINWLVIHFLHGPHRKHRSSIVACLFVAAGHVYRAVAQKRGA
jgi:hypothetical protein